MSVVNYYYSLNNNPEELIYNLLRGGSLKSHRVLISFGTVLDVLERRGGGTVVNVGSRTKIPRSLTSYSRHYTD